MMIYSGFISGYDRSQAYLQIHFTDEKTKKKWFPKAFDEKVIANIKKQYWIVRSEKLTPALINYDDEKQQLLDFICFI